MTGKQLKNSILQWAIQGKLVPQDPNDEPASVLLERIRAKKARLVKEKKIKKDKNESVIFRGEDNSYYEKMADGTVRCIDSEIPFAIPESWEWVRLGSIFAHNTGKALNGNGGAGEPHPYLTTSNVYWNSFDLSKVKTMNFSNEELIKCSISKGDLLVCEGGDIGRAAIWCYDYEICIQNHLHRLRAYCPICTAFFYLVFLLYKGSGVIGGKGIGIQGLSSGALHNILLPFPPFSEQERIKSVIDRIEPHVAKYEELYNNYTSINKEIYDLLKKSILQEAIQGRLVPQIESEGTAEQLLSEIRTEKMRLVKEGKLKMSALTADSRIVRGEDNRYYEQIGSNTCDITDSIPFEIPNNWIWVRLDSITRSVGTRNNQIQTKDIQTVGKYPVISQGLKPLDGYSDEEEKVIFDVPLVLFGDHTRNVKVVEQPFIIGADGTKLHKCIVVNHLYIYYWMVSISKSLRNRGYARHYSLLKATPIPLPPLEEQNRIVNQVSALFQLLK